VSGDTVPFYRKRYVGWLIQAAVLVLVYLGVQFYQTLDTPKGKLPSVTAQFLDGQVIRLPEDISEPVLIHFWATWCTVCRLEHGTIDSLSRSGNVVTVASHSGSADKVKAVVREREIIAPVLVDDSGTIAQRFGIRAFPTSFIVDRNGLIRYTEVGYTTELGLRLRLWLAGILQE